MPTIEQIENFGQTRSELKGGNAQRDLMVARILEEIEAGTAPWMKPWSSAVLRQMQPHNGATKHHYRGINVFWLMLMQEKMGTTDGRWMTFKQAKERGWSIKKGHKGVQVVYASRFQAKDENGEPEVDEHGNAVMRSFMKIATVFHASDIDGIPEQKIDREEVAVDPVIENLIQNSGVKLRHTVEDAAHYTPFADAIAIPDRHAFDESSEYTSTLLHELSHWTGHKSRLDRFTDKYMHFGSLDYAKEELVAEMSAFFTAMELGLAHQPSNTSAYLASWSRTVSKLEEKETSAAIRDAMFLAGKAADMLVDLAKGKSDDQNLAA